MVDVAAGLGQPLRVRIVRPEQDVVDPEQVDEGVDAILEGTPLIAPGEEGLGSVELANAMLYSSLIGEDLRLPLDGIAFEIKLSELIANSKFEKKTVEIKNDDFAQSFHR